MKKTPAAYKGNRTHSVNVYMDNKKVLFTQGGILCDEDHLMSASVMSSFKLF